MRVSQPSAPRIVANDDQHLEPAKRSIQYQHARVFTQRNQAGIRCGCMRRKCLICGRPAIHPRATRLIDQRSGCRRLGVMVSVHDPPDSAFAINRKLHGFASRRPSGNREPPSTLADSRQFRSSTRLVRREHDPKGGDHCIEGSIIKWHRWHRRAGSRLLDLALGQFLAHRPAFPRRCIRSPGLGSRRVTLCSMAGATLPQPLSRVGADGLRSRHHIFDGQSDLGPFARLQTAIRIDPELIGREPLRGRLQQQSHFIDGRNPR